MSVVTTEQNHLRRHQSQASSPRTVTPSGNQQFGHGPSALRQTLGSSSVLSDMHRYICVQLDFCLCVCSLRAVSTWTVESVAYIAHHFTWLRKVHPAATDVSLTRSLAARGFSLSGQLSRGYGDPKKVAGGQGRRVGL